MRIVRDLIEELKKFPMDASAYAYEGEVTGVIIIGADGEQLGYVPASEKSSPDGPAQFDAEPDLTWYPITPRPRREPEPQS